MAAIAVAPAINSSSPKLVATRLHTMLFVALFLTLTLGGLLSAGSALAARKDAAAP
jgi:hypothetical protein